MATFLRTFLKNFAWVLGGSLANIVFSFFSSIIVLFNLSIFGYGILALSLAVVNILSLFLNFMLFSVVNADIANEIGKKRIGRAKKILKSYAKLDITMGIFLFVTLFLVSDFAAELVSRPEVSGLLKVASFMLLLYGIKDLFKCTFQSSLNFKYSSMMNIIEPMARLGLVLGFTSFGAFNPTIALLCYALAIAISLVAVFPFLMRTIKIYKGTPTSKEPLLRKIVSTHGKWLIIREPFQAARQSIALWLIQVILTVEAVAIYALASKINSYIYALLTSIERVLIPTLSLEIARNKERVKRVFVRGIKYGAFLSTIAALLTMVFIGDLLNLLGLEKYAPSVPIIRLLLLTLVIYGFTYPLRPMLYAIKAQRTLTGIYMLGNAIFFSIGVYFVTILQSPIGIVVATLITSIIGNGLRYYYLIRREPIFKLGWKDLFKMDDYDKSLFRRIIKGARGSARREKTQELVEEPKELD